MIKDRYERNKKELLENSKINSKNRNAMKKLLEFEEYRLKRRNNLSEVDEHSYLTLSYYIGRLKKLNSWFKNKDWSKLTKVEIKKVIDNLEDGIIKNKYGKRYSDRSLYYEMMRGKLFKLIKKNNYASEILDEFEIQGRKDTNQVRYVPEEDFRKISDCATSPVQHCLFWVAFDIGENIRSLLTLEKDDFRRQINEETKEPEYLVFLKPENLKRSRTARSEITNYKETVQFLDIVLNNLKPSTKVITNKFMKNKKLGEIHNPNKLFKFGYESAERLLTNASEKAGVKSQPEGRKVCWKDLRSGMACDLLKKGWSRDEVNARLGHKPSSRMIDRYINFLALDRNKPKKKVYEGNLKKIEEDLINSKDTNKLQGIRIEKLTEDNENLRKEFNNLKKLIMKGTDLEMDNYIVANSKMAVKNII